MIATPLGLSCKEVVELVNDYLEGAMHPAEVARFEHHLGECVGCSEYLRQIRQVQQSAARLRENDVPETVRDALLQAFRQWKRQ